MLFNRGADPQEQVGVKLTHEQAIVVARGNQTHVGVSLNAIGAFLHDELLKLFLVSWGIKIFSLRDLQRLPDDLLIVAQSINLDGGKVLDRTDCRRLVELRMHLWVVNVDCAGLCWHKIGTENHLAELIVLHMLHACLLLGGVDVDTLVLVIHLLHKFGATVLRRQQLMMESVLLLLML